MLKVQIVTAIIVHHEYNDILSQNEFELFIGTVTKRNGFNDGFREFKFSTDAIIIFCLPVEKLLVYYT